MNIVCFTESLAAGGAQRQLVNLALLFQKKGHSVLFLTYREENFFLSELKENNIRTYQIPNKNYIERLFNTRKFLRSISVDIVISFLETPNFIACFSAIGRHRWKLITTELSAKMSTFTGKRSKIFIPFQRFSNKIVCNSVNAQKLWENYCPQYKSKLMTIYNPVLIRENEVQKNVTSKRTVVIPASYQYLKNPIRLIEAVNQLPEEKKKNIIIDWYGKKEPSKGNTAAYDEATALVKQYGLENVIHLNEEIHEIYNVMRKCDAVGLFSTVEGLPNAICEGMYMGKPIIMTKISDYDMFASGGGVFLCDAESVGSIRSALENFIDIGEDQLMRMSNANYELAHANFSPEVVINQWENLIANI